MRPKRSTDSEAQIRLQKLEDMVATLMRTTKEDAEKAGSKASSHNNVVDSSFRGLSIHNSSRSTEMPLGGHLSVDDSETNYLGATHWEAILENVCALLAYITSQVSANKCRFEIFKAPLEPVPMTANRHHQALLLQILTLCSVPSRP